MNLSAILENNKKYYRLYTYIRKSFLIWTIMLIYLKDKGLSFTEVMLLSSIGALVTFIFEVPSGIFADLYGRKKTLLIGELFVLASFLIVLLSNRYYFLCINAIFSGIGEAFISGAGTALIYDTFVFADKENEYKSYTSDIFTWSFRCSAIAAILAGLLYNYNIHIPMMITIILASINIILLIKLIDISKRKVSNFRTELNKQINNIKQILKSAELIKIFGIYLIMMIIISNINFLSQAYLRDIHVNVAYFGFIFFIFNIASSYGAKFARNKEINNFSLILSVFAICLFGLYLSNNYLGVLFLVGTRLLNGFIFPVLDADINTKIDTENRATILSYKSLIVQIAFIVFDPIIGIITDYKNAHFTYLVMCFTTIMLVLFTSITKKAKRWCQRKL